MTEENENAEPEVAHLSHAEIIEKAEQRLEDLSSDILLTLASDGEAHTELSPFDTARLHTDVLVKVAAQIINKAPDATYRHMLRMHFMLMFREEIPARPE